MDEQHLKIWEVLFQRALDLIDSASCAGTELQDWSFGGGTVLMRRHHHRFSKDIDIFFRPAIPGLPDTTSERQGGIIDQ